MVVSQALQVSLDLLFSAGALVALGSIAASWFAAAPTLRALRAEFTQPTTTRNFRYAVRNTSPAPAQAVRVLRKPVSRRAVAQRPVRIAAGLRAAA